MTDHRTRSIPPESASGYPSRVSRLQQQNNPDSHSVPTEYFPTIPQPQGGNSQSAPQTVLIPSSSNPAAGEAVNRVPIMPVASAQPTVTLPSPSIAPGIEVSPAWQSTQPDALTAHSGVENMAPPSLATRPMPAQMPEAAPVYPPTVPRENPYSTYPNQVADPNQSPQPNPELTDPSGKKGSGRRVWKGASDSEKENKKPPVTGWRKAFRSIWETVLVILIAIVMSVIVKAYLIQAFEIPSGSMEDTLQINDRIIVSRLTPKVWDIERGDIVVFYDSQNWLKRPEQPETTGVKKTLITLGVIPDPSRSHLVKRVIGIPGDHIVCDGKGKLVINGVAVDETKFIKPGAKPSEIPFDITVPPGKLWVMGDNRGNSEDSRLHQDLPGHGFVPISDVNGKAIMRMWPLDRLSLIPDVHAYDKLKNANVNR